MKINPINLQNYKKNITGQTIFSNTFYTNPLSFGNDSFEKKDDSFGETAELRKRYEQINQERMKKVYDSSLESQEELMRENERTLREYKKINEILNKSDKQNYSKDLDIILKYFEAMDNLEKNKGFNRISGYEEIKEKLKEEFILSSIMKDRTSQGADVPNVVLFYGPSNNGKTAFAQALAEQSLSNIVTIIGGEDDAMEMIKNAAQKALKNYNESSDKKRTIIVLNEAELLTNKYSTDLDEFKDFIKDCSDKYKCTLFLTSNTPLLIDKDILAQTSFKVKDCSDKYKCTLFLTSNTPLLIDKDILAQTSFKVPVEPADRKTCKEIIVDNFNTVNIKPEGNIDNLVNAFFVDPEKIYSNGDIVHILKTTLLRKSEPQIADFIRTLKKYDKTSIDGKRMKQFEEAKKALAE